MPQIKVVVTSPRNTVYQRAHRTATVLYTERVAELVEQGVLTVVAEGTAQVDTKDRPVAVINPPTRRELAQQAEALGIEVKPSWSKTRLSEEIAERTAEKAASAEPAGDVETVETSPEDSEPEIVTPDLWSATDAEVPEEPKTGKER